jgi:hypothetical protein
MYRSSIFGNGAEIAGFNSRESEIAINQSRGLRILEFCAYIGVCDCQVFITSNSVQKPVNEQRKLPNST